MLFDKKVVVVTGGSSGIGLEIANQFAENGATVVVADIAPPQQLHSFKYVCADVSSPLAIKSLFETVKCDIGKLDVLINNAGISLFVPFEELDLETWEKVIHTNLRSVFLCAQAALPLMKNDGGKIINIASTRALMSEPNTEAYSASKGGILALTHSLAMSLSKYNIQVNAISPGWIHTSDYDQLRDVDHTQHPSRRVGKPSDIARASLFLASPDNEFVNGANLVIDGGMTVKMIYEE